ncbi:hypothetical protein BHE74_00001854 [Ensete ventricosum]|nr:hypothetical protein BHE74_00001854 [Ensete ventricosum]
MDVTLSKAHKAYPDCSALASKLRAQLYNAEEQLRAQQNQASYLVRLTARTFPKGLHCLSMKLTTEFFTLRPEDQQLPNSQNVDKPDFYHFAIFSDNVLACAVAVNSTVTTSMGQSRQLWEAGSLPLGQLLFYNHTTVFDRRWHVLGLGRESGMGRAEIERAAVIHYDGSKKPWLDIAIPKYRRYWTKFLHYGNPYFQQCNIHE